MSKPLHQVQDEIMYWTEQFKNNESKNREFNNCEEWLRALIASFSFHLDQTTLTVPLDTVSKVMQKAISEVGIPLQELAPFLGMVEEIGELAAAMVKRHQGRGFEDKKVYDKTIADGIADLDIFACDYANRVGVHREANLSETWEKVQKRKQKTWEQDKAKEDFKTTTGEKLSGRNTLIAGNEWTTQPCVTCGGSGKVHSHNDICFDCDGMGALFVDNRGRSFTKRRYMELIGEIPSQTETTQENDWRRAANPREALRLLVRDYIDWEEYEARQMLYQETASIGLMYGEEAQTNLEEGIGRKLSVLCEEAIGLLLGKDGQRVLDKLNDIRRLNPAVYGEPLKPIHKSIRKEYEEKFKDNA